MFVKSFNHRILNSIACQFLNELHAKNYASATNCTNYSCSPDACRKITQIFSLFDSFIRYVDLFTLPTDYLTDEDGAFVTFHPSRLMGLFDMLNTDNLVDLISGLGVPKQKILITLPANAYKFTLRDENENAPRSETTEKEPIPLDREQVRYNICFFFFFP